jgi:hypothetical protein
MARRLRVNGFEFQPGSTPIPPSIAMGQSQQPQQPLQYLQPLPAQAAAATPYVPQSHSQFQHYQLPPIQPAALNPTYQPFPPPQQPQQLVQPFYLPTAPIMYSPDIIAPATAMYQPHQMQSMQHFQNPDLFQSQQSQYSQPFAMQGTVAIAPAPHTQRIRTTPLLQQQNILPPASAATPAVAVPVASPAQDATAAFFLPTGHPIHTELVRTLRVAYGEVAAESEVKGSAATPAAADRSSLSKRLAGINQLRTIILTPSNREYLTTYVFYT